MTDTGERHTASHLPAPWRLQGEAWVALCRSERPAPLPPGLAPLLGGRWLVVALARYQSGTLRYHELIVGRLAWRGLFPGLLVEAIWVDDPASRAGGRAIWGLPKELATFDWQDDTARVSDADGPLVTLRVERPALRLPWLPLLAPAFGRRDDVWLYLVGRAWARLGRGGLGVVSWSSRLPARPAGQLVLSLAALPLRLTVPPPLALRALGQRKRPGMSDNGRLRGKTALVTGASSGLGAGFARELAARGCDLVLVARREERLNALRVELVERHGVAVSVLPLDLTTPGAPECLHAWVKERGLVIGVLINNAGFGLYGRFDEIPWEREGQMLTLNMLVPVHLTRLFVAEMRARDEGYILNVASIGAFAPTPLYASYAATKSFILNWGEALNYELRGTGVRCTVVAPGVTATEFLSVTGQRATFYQRLVMMRSQAVVHAGIQAMLAGRPSIVPGRLNALSARLLSLLPRRWQAALAYRTMR